jgi:hypothetical protein
VERDERIADVRRRAEGDRHDAAKVGDELISLYADPNELLKHARVQPRGDRGKRIQPQHSALRRHFRTRAAG